MLWIIIALLAIIVVLLGGGGIFNALFAMVGLLIMVLGGIHAYTNHPVLFWGFVALMVVAVIAVLIAALISHRRFTRQQRTSEGLRPLLKESVLIEPQIYQHPDGTYVLLREGGALSAFRDINRARLFRDRQAVAQKYRQPLANERRAMIAESEQLSNGVYRHPKGLFLAQGPRGGTRAFQTKKAAEDYVKR